VKLTNLHESYGPEVRAQYHKQISHTMRSPDEKYIISRIRAYLLKGSSSLKEPLKTGQVNMDTLIDAVKSKRCVGLENQDLGHTYIKNTVGQAIRKLFPEGGKTSANDARRAFGLPEIHRK
jgi:hypothetical protein